jgi:hypothetical protein
MSPSIMSLCPSVLSHGEGRGIVLGFVVLNSAFVVAFQFRRSVLVVARPSWCQLVVAVVLSSSSDLEPSCSPSSLFFVVFSDVAATAALSVELAVNPGRRCLRRPLDLTGPL